MVRKSTLLDNLFNYWFLLGVINLNELNLRVDNHLIDTCAAEIEGSSMNLYEK